MKKGVECQEMTGNKRNLPFDRTNRMKEMPGNVFEQTPIKRDIEVDER